MRPLNYLSPANCKVGKRLNMKGLCHATLSHRAAELNKVPTPSGTHSAAHKKKKNNKNVVIHTKKSLLSRLFIHRSKKKLPNSCLFVRRRQPEREPLGVASYIGHPSIPPCFFFLFLSLSLPSEPRPPHRPSNSLSRAAGKHGLFLLPFRVLPQEPRPPLVLPQVLTYRINSQLPGRTPSLLLPTPPFALLLPLRSSSSLDKNLEEVARGSRLLMKSTRPFSQQQRGFYQPFII